jgi:hypothetical protein
MLVVPSKPEAPAKDPMQTVASGPLLALQAWIVGHAPHDGMDFVREATSTKKETVMQSMTY